MPLVKDTPETVEEPKILMDKDEEQRPVRAGFNQPLTEYDLHKDRQIGVAGIVQAVIQSQIYAACIMTMKSDEEIDNFLVSKVRFWIEKVKELSK